jgi:Notch 1
VTGARLVLVLGCLGVLPLAGLGCTFDEDRNAALGCEGCPEESCHLGFCFAPEVGPATGNGGGGGDGGGGTGGRAGGDAGGAAGAPPTAGTSGGAGSVAPNGDDASVPDAGADAGPEPPEPCVEGDFCYDGPDDTRTVGRCRAGIQSCNGEGVVACLGQITPGEESCNGLDDDCDGEIDEDVMLGSCETGVPGACAAGVMRCEQGSGLCEQMSAAEREVCNAVDDDCDGMTDEATAIECYPEGAAGCVAGDDGSFSCAGQCQSGESVCEDGELQPCAGFIEPASETCEGTDENCDGEIDEGCECLNDATQECYSGPSGTAGVGTCQRGMQTCVDGAFGACMGAITPVAESCANEGANDDCDAVPDDVAGRNDPCTVSTNLGVCRNGTLQCVSDSLECVTPEPPADAETAGEAACDGHDEDCDGVVDDGFDLQTDRANCGECGNACTGRATCCGGACVLLGRDPLHCGECGNACGDGVTCCGGSCVDLQTDDANCGACGTDCETLGAALGTTCSCTMGACTSPDGPCMM